MPVTAKSLGKRIAEARLRQGLSQAELAKILGVSQQAVALWERGVHAPRTRLEQIATALGTTFEALAFGLAEAEADGRWAGLPMQGWRDNDEPGDSPLRAQRRNHFGMRVEGLAMAPEFRPGDTVIVDPDRRATDGDYCVVRLSSGETVLRQYVRDGDKTYWRATNPEFPNRVSESEPNDACLGVVVAKIKPYVDGL